MSQPDLLQAITFLQDRAGEALRLLDERANGSEQPAGATAASDGSVPGGHDHAVLHLGAVAGAAPELRALRSYLHDYADRLAEVSGSDTKLVAVTDSLRRLMEAIYEQPITFSGERPADDRVDGWDLARAQADARSATLIDDAPEGTQWIVRNLTDREIELTRRGLPAYVVPAFGSRRFLRSSGAWPSRGDERSNGQGTETSVQLDGGPKATFDHLDSLIASDVVEVTEIPPVTASESVQVIVLGLEFWLVPLFVIATLLWGNSSWWLFGIPVLVGLPLLAGIRRENWAKLAQHFRNALRNAPRRGMELSSLVLVIVFGFVVPAVAVFLGADLHDVADRALKGSVTDGGPDDLTLIARTMQVLFIAAASMLPALLYFQFDRERLGTIWEKFMRQIYRLDPYVRTEPALLSKYGFLMDEVFGPGERKRGGSLLPGKRSPIIVATAVISFGWVLTLLNPQIGTISDQAGFVSLFEPHQSAVTFAFLGAYVFALGAVLRGYVRRDLRPKSYSDITVRILTVVALAWLLEVFFPDEEPVLLAFAFATGLVPQTAFTLLRETVQGARTARRGTAPADPSDQQATALLDNDPLPLTNLEGIDLYDRARLASEGITNIEALAHSDLIELMLQTRIPAARLVDWVDQAILYLHISRDDGATEPSSYDVLRSAGIRNATDLIRAADKAERRGGADVLAFMGMLGSVRAEGPHRLSVVLDAIEDEEWISNLIYWRLRGDLENPRVKDLIASAAPTDSTTQGSRVP